MKQYFNICNIYILLWCLFNYTFALSMPISRPIFALLFAITAYYTVYAVSNYKLPIYMKGLLVLLSLFTVYGVLLLFSDVQLYISMVDKEVSKYVYLITIYKSLLPVFPFFVFASRGELTEKSIRWWMPVFILFTIATFYATNSLMMSVADSGRVDFTNNTGYVFVSLMPLVFLFYNRKFWQYALLIVMMAYVVLSMKRGAVVTGGVFVLWFIFWKIKSSNSRRKLLMVAMSIGLLAVVYYLFNQLYSSSEYFRFRVESTMEGQTSGRDSIYEYLWFYYNTYMTEFQQLFGMGAESTLLIGDNYAHNDWLEILINNGALGTLVYAIYWLCFIVSVKRAHSNSLIFPMMIGVCSIYFLKTLFSMSYGDMTCYATMTLGYCLAIGMQSSSKPNLKNKLYI